MAYPLHLWIDQEGSRKMPSSNFTCFLVLQPGDVVGCLFNNHNGLVFWTVNGERLGHVLQLELRDNHQEDAHCDENGQVDDAPTAYNDDIIYLPSSVLGLSPAISLRNTSVEHVNVIPISTYHRTAAGRLNGQPLSALVPSTGSSLPPRHHSNLERGAFHASVSRFTGGLSAGRGHSALQSLRKSISSVSAPATSGVRCMAKFSLFCFILLL
ncbi:unnamed protein product [Dibothriocephalus latus]|uniref:B30.2/SPRY domain-containing protein n=1 Tax=Dibothriocephalus latus TaxID=60516 RepID=A0A3P7NL47_DIBLA|nr:unnamed protein product [Dibothriocephalus latus]